MRRAVALGALLLSGGALAQDVRPERLYLNPSGVLLGSTRVTALGGAYVGVAEGADGFTSNLAALAHRSHHLDRDWDVGFTASWLDLPFITPTRRDLDNDGSADQAQVTRQFLAGLMLQFKQFGIGWYWRTTTLWYCKLQVVACTGANDQIEVNVANTVLAAAVALGRDDFIAALGIFGAVASFDGFMDGEPRHYAGTGIEFDVLYRPHGLNYRVGVSVRPQVVGFYQPDSGAGDAQLDGRRLYSAVTSPAVLSFGASMRLGEGAERYNRYSKAARRDILKRFGETELPEEEPADAPAGNWLLTAQVDLISATENTVPVSAFIDMEVQLGIRSAELVGRQAYLAPHVGLEHDTVPGRLRSRVGTFIEPSAFPDHAPRLHGALGFELFLAEYVERWSLSGSGDFAHNYYNVGLSLGLWR
ncbi:MAG: hypothetical protein ACYC8T_31965 [Myxococcaceae bacterium]